MKVRVTKSDGEAWYSNHIGETFEVEQKKNRLGGFFYIVLPRDSNGDYYIDESDCEIVVEDDE